VADGSGDSQHNTFETRESEGRTAWALLKNEMQKKLQELSARREKSKVEQGVSSKTDSEGNDLKGEEARSIWPPRSADACCLYWGKVIRGGRKRGVLSNNRARSGFGRKREGRHGATDGLKGATLKSKGSTWRRNQVL